jgi:hypothetical protein
MNALTTIEAAQMPAGFDAWMQQGRALLERRDAIEWDLADWIAGGEAQFGKQLGLDLLADQLGIAPKRLKTAAKVAKAFPAAYRAPGLPFDVYCEIARVEPDHRLPMLNEAARDHWTQAVASDRVEEWRTSTGRRLANDDEVDAQGSEIVRAWNRAGSPEARELIWPYLLNAARTGFGTINMGVEIDA